MKFVFIQCFSLGDVGGGPNILRSVADDAPVPVASICTGFGRERAAWTLEESLIPIRPSLGRIDRTRFAWLGGYVESLWGRHFEQRLERELVRLNATDVHLLPHSWGDFVAGFRAAQRLGLRVHISIHDDFIYTAKEHPRLAKMEVVLREVWRRATTRFVISQEMGLEYCRRYGDRTYLIHTDGCTPSLGGKFVPPSTEVRLYFMGMFNNTYLPNFRALMTALERHQTTIGQGLPVRFTVRTQGFNPEDLAGKEWVNLLPFASSEVVGKEMGFQHLLYLPLPLEPEWSNLCQFSLSTKMVSYMASGVPIVYHGPESSAAGQYLCRNDAAFALSTNDPDVIALKLADFLTDTGRMRAISENAQSAVKADFDRITLKNRFWTAVIS